jgi:hypothetical protein
MKIAVLSDTRLPTLPDGSHGLGRSAYDIATGLAEQGCQVDLFAAPDSQFEHGRVFTHGDENGRARWLAEAVAPGYDAILDTSHYHLLSRLRPDWPIVNRICDRECTWQPPNAVVNSGYMRGLFPAAHQVNTGINAAVIPFWDKAAEPPYLAFGGNPHEGQRGYEIARRVSERTGVPLQVASNLTGQKKWEWLGRALALLSPSVHRAAPRLPLEAAACGTPTLCLDGDGCQQHVRHTVTGFVCSDEDEMVLEVHSVFMLDRMAIRCWVESFHRFGRMVERYEELLAAVATGERW